MIRPIAYSQLLIANRRFAVTPRPTLPLWAAQQPSGDKPIKNYYDLLIRALTEYPYKKVKLDGALGGYLT